MKRAAETIARAADSLGVLKVLEYLGNSGGLRVLVYHRVAELGDEIDLDPSLISASPEEFRGQMQLLVSRYKPVGVSEVLEAHRSGRRLPNDAVLVTFDDAYQDFSTNAWPVLKEFGVPATMFVPTLFPDRGELPGFWWDRVYSALRRSHRKTVTLPDVGVLTVGDAKGTRESLKVCKLHVKSLPHNEAMSWVDEAVNSLAELPPLHRVMDWQELRGMAGQGLDVCAHGHTHALCSRLDDRELESDLVKCKERLVDELGGLAQPSVIAWPANAFSDRVRQVALATGFELGFGGVRGVADLPFRDSLNVMRIPVNRYQRSLFRAQLRPSVARAGRWATGLRQFVPST